MRKRVERKAHVKGKRGVKELATAYEIYREWKKAYKRVREKHLQKNRSSNENTWSSGQTVGELDDRWNIFACLCECMSWCSWTDQCMLNYVYLWTICLSVHVQACRCAFVCVCACAHARVLV